MKEKGRKKWREITGKKKTNKIVDLYLNVLVIAVKVHGQNSLKDKETLREKKNSVIYMA